MPVSTSDAFAFKNATISNTAKSLLDLTFTQAEIDAADVAWVTVVTAPIRLRYDSGTPTASVGHYMDVNTGVPIWGRNNLNNLKFIRASGVDGEVSVTLEKF